MGKRLSAGDKAPAFDLPSDSGKNVKLGDYKGKTFVLYFYPKDNTPGCTREAQAFTTLLPKFKKAGVDVLGVSKDSVASHCGFRDKLKLKVALLSDPDLTVHNAYGAFGEKVMYGKKVKGVIRSTFLIENGKIKRSWGSVKVDGHAEAVLEALSEE
jgi:thioredoxin-dependent peroxiredoxin